MSNSILQEASAHNSVDKNVVLLSEHGCGRATAYADGNKIITLQDKTHVAWLDSIAEGFRVRIPDVGPKNEPMVSHIYRWRSV